MSAGLVSLKALLDALKDGLLIFPAIHVDEVGDNNSANVPEAHLPTDFVGGFKVRLQDRSLDVLGAFVASGVHVHGDESLGFIDHDVAAARKPDLAVKGCVDLGLDTKAVKDRL